ncbi:MAG: hypothetical protein U0559_08285 [Anaerolineae bacterium]
MPKPAGLHGFIGNLDKVKREELSTAQLDAQVALLRAWQSQRLAHTYQDLLDDERHRPACEFFLDDIYGPRDFSQRDHDIEQVYVFMRRFMPDAMLRPVALTVELHQMTQALDQTLLGALVDQLGVTDTITPELYTEAYRLCNNYDERVKQIQLIVEICERIDGIVRNPLTGPALSVAKRPMRSAGHGELIGFLERGYTGFKHMRGSQYFRSLIQTRELNLLDRMYSGETNPFGLPAPIPTH